MVSGSTLKHEKIYVGIDIGSVSSKIVLLSRDLEFFQKISLNCRTYFLRRPPAGSLLGGEWALLVSDYTRTQGEPVPVTFELLAQLKPFIAAERIGGVRVTGAGAERFGKILGVPPENEFRALATGVGLFYSDIDTILEIGGSSSKYIAIQVEPDTSQVHILDYSRNGDCAAGTGVFIDQQASRLRYPIEAVGELVVNTEVAATIAGRCSVFAKSDMIHAQQKGYQPPQILKGLCAAVIRNFKGTIIKGKALGQKVAFVGGVAANQGAVQAIQEILELSPAQFMVPELYAWMGAVGAALNARQATEKTPPISLFNPPSATISAGRDFPRGEPLSLEKVILLRHTVPTFTLPQNSTPVNAYLGIDVGSVSTKLVVIDEAGHLIKEIYTRTEARPIAVVQRGLETIGAEFGARLVIKGVGTTGSGRELIGQLVGADTINDEITAHKTGAMFISRTYLDQPVDTIFDIGGQDSKFIAIEDGVVVDFTMNEACAAGTGSFLEEQAERLGVNIIDEFSELALNSTQPILLGERCTVFMEKVLVPYLQQGAEKVDLVAGLTYSIVLNYLNRVVRGRRIGKVIYFQGGTAYNNAVAAAFSTILKKEIIVPPFNGVLGAVGAALLAQTKMAATNQASRFRGFNVSASDYQWRNFTCKGCSNYCDIQEFTVATEKSYWGDRCSDRYRRHRRSAREPIIPDLIEVRAAAFQPFLESNGSGPKIGFPRSMYFFDRLPFWSTYLKALGFQLVFSDPTNKKIINQGVDVTLAEPCFPIVVAHGHIQNLIDQGVDFIFQPNVINAETQFPQIESFLCPWGQTQPFVFKHVPAFKAYWERFLAPTVRFREGQAAVEQVLWETFRKFGVRRPRHQLLVAQAYQAQSEFEAKLTGIGAEVLQQLAANQAPAVVLLGRPYNLYDMAINLNIPAKLRDYYGVNVIFIDFLPLAGIDVFEIHDSMFWNFGLKILQAAKFARHQPDLHLIYFTNFKCGPDSYVKHFVGDAVRSPYLVLQFDSHSNDAGIITRCEAYLHSKGFFS
ncbi:acyl-CoA dehydratase activase [candidate division KSB1 bacterium]|nr:acyl-CoA dehydratase activase [candidate division KSB1 bacterium]